MRFSLGYGSIASIDQLDSDQSHTYVEHCTVIKWSAELPATSVKNAPGRSYDDQGFIKRHE
jgi:hypothetical protein